MFKGNKGTEGYVLDATPKYFAIAQKEGEAGEEIYPAQLTQWQKLGVEVYYLGATYKCNMYDSKGVLKVAKHFLDDKGNANHIEGITRWYIFFWFV